MGELAEALRRANDEADRTARSTRSAAGGVEPAARTLSLDEVLGRARRDAKPDDDEEASGSEVRAALRAAAEAAPPTRSDATLPVQALSREDEAGFRAQRVGIDAEPTAGGAAARRLAQKVKRSTAARGIRSIVVTSALRGEGKTTTACNLAIALTRLDRSESVVLVDLDLRQPSVARSLGILPSRTVNDVIERRATLEEALVTTDVPGLYVLATARGTRSPESLLASQRLRDLIQQLERRFSRVVLDTPPTLVVGDASAVIEAAGGFLFVARSGSTPTKSIQGALEHLPREKMMGCVLNFAREGKSLPTEYYYAEREGERDARHAGESPDTGSSGDADRGPAEAIR